jgi:Raf kinase inhibitor-like YbhB/YbcL family protein
MANPSGPGPANRHRALTVTYGFIAVLLIVLLTLLILAAITPARAAEFTLTSPDISAGSTITNNYVYNGFGCTGQNISPALNWTGAPKGTQSFAVMVYDPDAPTGSGWWHWIVYDIDPSAFSGGLPADLAGLLTRIETPNPTPKFGRNDYGTESYGGPCPPVGDKPHRYEFTVFALPVTQLELPTNPSAALIGYNLRAKALGTAHFTAMYGRQERD